MIRDEHDEQIAKFDLLIDKQKSRYRARMKAKDREITELRQRLNSN